MWTGARFRRGASDGTLWPCFPRGHSGPDQSFSAGSEPGRDARELSPSRIGNIGRTGRCHPELPSRNGGWQPASDYLVSWWRLCIPSGPAPILAGDNAGGHLALVTALDLARKGRPVAGLLLFSPNTDRSGLSKTRAQADKDAPDFDDRCDKYLAKLCFGDRSTTDPQVSPLLDDLSLLPPTWIEVGAHEVLLDDSRLLFARAEEAGADIHLTVTENLMHMAQIWALDWAAATESLDRAAEFAKSLTPQD